MKNHLKTFTLLAAMTALFGAIGYLVGGPFGMMVALVVAGALNLFSYWNADQLVLRAYRAVEVDEKAQSPVIRAYVADVIALAQRAKLPKPRIYVIDNPQPNAFATGRDPAHAAVAATTGLLQMLNREEVAGVMAHELAHVKNRDTLVMTVTATIAGAIAMLANFALLFGGDRERPNPLAALAIAVIAPLAASVIQMTISRAREYEADRIGAEIAGDPTWLARALEKIDRGARQMMNHQAQANPASAHLFIINPLRGGSGDNLFSTHPSTANRVQRLMAMAQGSIDARALDGGPWGAPSGGQGYGPANPTRGPWE